MAENNTEQLEGHIFLYVNNAFKEKPPTKIEFEETANTVRQAFALLCPVTDEEFTGIIQRLRASIAVEMELGVVIRDERPHQSWLPARRSEIDFFFWGRYKNYLQIDKQRNPRIIATLDRVSDEIVDLLGDPKSSKDFQRRGLVIGDVQSGKTANYTAICNKAADAGYRVIIVLAGMKKVLRQQTQERLDAEFSGILSQHLLSPKARKNVPVGVGKYSGEKEKRRRIESFTSTSEDFNANIIRTLNLSLHSVEAPVLFVVQKNKKILDNLIKWLKSNSTDGEKTVDLPMLLIDDEADNASVNTKKKDDDPTAINDGIRRLLKLFRQTSYLGITATPYANIFINPDTSDEMRGDDLFPRDFIYSLSPPTDYIGAVKIFGEEAPFKDSLETLYPSEMDAFFPFKHKKGHRVEKLPPSMKKAMAYFLLVNGIRDIRGDRTHHRSMMIHVSRNTDVQDHIQELANVWLKQMQSDLQNFAGLPESESIKKQSIADLKKVWEEYKLYDKAGKPGSPMPWHRFLSEYLYKAVAPIDVKAVNQNSGSLDYSSHLDNGLRVIVVGGDSLSRGLTLEGLCVSFFYRRSIMYDTLLQMGRWFGYRHGYDDLVKIWVSEELIDWYGYITSASEELKQDIAMMKHENLTPLQFGLMVRQAPNSLIVTARNKMQTAQKIVREISVSGHLLETPRLKSDSATLDANKSVFNDFVYRLDDIGQRVVLENNPRYFWRGIDKSEIEFLLREFVTLQWHLSYHGKALADFIKKRMDDTPWDVVIAEGSKDNEPYTELFCGSERISIWPEKRAVRVKKKEISISGTKVRVGAGGMTAYGLSPEDRQNVIKKFQDNSHGNSKQVPDSAYLNCEYLGKKRAPILILHVIAVDRDSKDKKSGELRTQIDEGCQVPDYLFALGVGFPSSESVDETATYMVNLVKLRNYYGVKEDDDE